LKISEAILKRTRHQIFYLNPCTFQPDVEDISY